MAWWLEMIDPIVESKLTLEQRREIAKLAFYKPEVNGDSLARLITEEIFNKGIVVNALLKAVEAIGAFAIDKGKKIWRYEGGVWLPDGFDELTRRIAWCTDTKYRKEFVQQVASLITARSPMINGLGPRELMNVRNGMLDWQTFKLIPHDPKYYSTYQLQVSWNPEAKCPSVDSWIEKTFDPEIHKLLWQIIGVVWHPGMGFQKAITFIGNGLNGKGTFLRLCNAALPDSAISAIDPRILVSNRFASADLFGKTANICGDIERFTFNSTAEFKKITGQDPLHAERKMGQPFTFTSQATMLFSGNKMPQSRDTSFGWFRRWLIVPMTRQIIGPSDPNLEPQLHKELEGVLVKAVMGLREAMDAGSYDNPEVCKRALEDYEYSCNSSALFINEKLEFSDSHKLPISKSRLMDSYSAFCRERRLERGTRNEFYKMLEELGGEQLQSHWLSKGTGESDRGYLGVAFKLTLYSGF